jgi:hypothetical protein
MKKWKKGLRKQDVKEIDIFSNLQKKVILKVVLSQLLLYLCKIENSVPTLPLAL